MLLSEVVPRSYLHLVSSLGQWSGELVGVYKVFKVYKVRYKEV